MDYNFISVGEFRDLDENGLLLESGTYDGRCQAQNFPAFQNRHPVEILGELNIAAWTGMDWHFFTNT